MHPHVYGLRIACTQVQAFLAMHKIDELVLPLPYSQLLKIFTTYDLGGALTGLTIGGGVN